MTSAGPPDAGPDPERGVGRSRDASMHVGDRSASDARAGRDPATRRWARQLLSLSPQKQEKLRVILDLLEDTEGMTCLDIGGDNGVISLMLREIGGAWHSADLDDKSVRAIRDVVGTRVRRITPGEVPYPEGMFDLVVVVDYLEHVEDDGGLIQQLHRIQKDGGVLVVNVPYRRDRSVLYRLRELLGIGDARHGHVRAGYTPEELARLLSPYYTVRSIRTYSHLPLELLDVALNTAYAVVRRGTEKWGDESDKGALVTRDQWEKETGKFRMLRMLSPIFSLVKLLDGLAPTGSGYKLTVRADRHDDAG